MSRKRIKLTKNKYFINMLSVYNSTKILKNMGVIMSFRTLGEPAPQPRDALKVYPDKVSIVERSMIEIRKNKRAEAVQKARLRVQPPVAPQNRVADVKRVVTAPQAAPAVSAVSISKLFVEQPQIKNCIRTGRAICEAHLRQAETLMSDINSPKIDAFREEYRRCVWAIFEQVLGSCDKLGYDQVKERFNVQLAALQEQSRLMEYVNGKAAL